MLGVDTSQSSRINNSSSAFSCLPYAIGVITALAAVIIIGLGASGRFGSFGSSGFYISVGSGSKALLATAVGGILYVALHHCKSQNVGNHPPLLYIKNPSESLPLGSFKKGWDGYCFFIQSGKFGCFYQTTHGKSDNITIYDLEKCQAIDTISWENSLEILDFQYPYLILKDPKDVVFKNKVEETVSIKNVNTKEIIYSFPSEISLHAALIKEKDLICRGFYDHKFRRFIIRDFLNGQNKLEEIQGFNHGYLVHNEKLFVIESRHFARCFSVCGVTVLDLSDEKIKAVDQFSFWNSLDQPTCDEIQKVENPDAFTPDQQKVINQCKLEHHFSSHFVQEDKLFLSNGSSLHIWDLKSKQLIKTILTQEPWTIIGFETPLLAISIENGFEVWDIERNERVKWLTTAFSAVFYNKKLFFVKNSTEQEDHIEIVHLDFNKQPTFV